MKTILVAALLLVSLTNIKSEVLLDSGVVDIQTVSLCDATGGLCSELVCSPSGISVTLDAVKLKQKNIDVTSVHLLDRRCTGFPYDDESVYMTWSLGQGICGTELIVTGTHAIYKNYIYLPPDPQAIIWREAIIINVTCSYPLNMNVSLPGVLWPDLSIVYIGIENSGQFKVKMAIYKDISYTTPYTDSVISLSTQSNLYVGVYIEDSGNAAVDFSLLMINCYSTPTNNIYDAVKYNIIINQCPNPQDSTIKILENGISSQGKFYLQMFKFIGDYSYVYLHCGVYLCKDTCAPNCYSRSSSDKLEAQATMTLGPIRLLSDKETDTDSVGKASGFSIAALLVLALANIFTT
ncbi:uromodulin-like [Hyperolius riggenbachi]|uniref:uromodulin-like n=1 Tax=Hyperolius riggenbachi TaxID=752182 RepID=UPI0035A2E6D6